MTPDRSLAVHQRIYRMLLLLYPRAFRQVYGGDMVQVFGDRLRDERSRSGHKASFAVWLRTLLDLFKSAPTQRMEKAMSREAAFAIAFTLMLVVAFAFFAEGIGGLAINIILGVLILGAIGLGVSGVLDRKHSAKPAPAGRIKLKDWWVVLAATVGGIEILAVVLDAIHDPKPSNLAALVVVGTFGSLMVAGAWVRTKSRAAGDWMIVIGVLPLAGLWWMIFPVVIAAMIMIMAIRDTFKGRESEAAPA